MEPKVVCIQSAVGRAWENDKGSLMTNALMNNNTRQPFKDYWKSISGDIQKTSRGKQTPGLWSNVDLDTKNFGYWLLDVRVFVFFFFGKYEKDSLPGVFGNLESLLHFFMEKKHERAKIFLVTDYEGNPPVEVHKVTVDNIEKGLNMLKDCKDQFLFFFQGHGRKVFSAEEKDGNQGVLEVPCGPVGIRITDKDIMRCVEQSRAQYMSFILDGCFPDLHDDLAEKYKVRELYVHLKPPHSKPRGGPDVEQDNTTKKTTIWSPYGHMRDIISFVGFFVWSPDTFKSLSPSFVFDNPLCAAVGLVTTLLVMFLARGRLRVLASTPWQNFLAVMSSFALSVGVVLYTSIFKESPFVIKFQTAMFLGVGFIGPVVAVFVYVMFRFRELRVLIETGKLHILFALFNWLVMTRELNPISMLGVSDMIPHSMLIDVGSGVTKEVFYEPLRFRETGTLDGFKVDLHDCYIPLASGEEYLMPLDTMWLQNGDSMTTCNWALFVATCTDFANMKKGSPPHKNILEWRRNTVIFNISLLGAEADSILKSLGMDPGKIKDDEYIKETNHFIKEHVAKFVSGYSSAWYIPVLVGDIAFRLLTVSAKNALSLLWALR